MIMYMNMYMKMIMIMSMIMRVGERKDKQCRGGIKVVSPCLSPVIK